MDEHDVVEAGTDLLLGDPKSALKKIGLSVFDKKQFEAIFVSAGKTVAEYEKDNNCNRWLFLLWKKYNGQRSRPRSRIHLYR